MRYVQFCISWLVQCVSRVPEKIFAGGYLHRKFFGQEHLREAERIKRKNGTGVIFAINHVSHFDPIIFLAGISPFSSLAPMFWLSFTGKQYKTDEKFKLLSLIYGDLFFYMYGCIPPQSGFKDYAVALSKHSKLVAAGGSLAVFPEGKILLDTQREKPRGGIAYLAEKTGAPIVPVYIGGLKRLTVREFWAGTRHATVTYGKPFFLSDLGTFSKEDPERYHHIAEKILDRVYALSDMMNVNTA